MVMMPLMVMLLVMMMMVVDAAWVYAPHPLFLPNNFKSPLFLLKYIFFNTGSAPVWIRGECQIICNRSVARIALQQWDSVNFDPCPLG